MALTLTVEQINSQIDRAYLREGFLKKISYLKGKRCSLKLYENTNVKGTFEGNDVKIQEFLLSDLETPTCVDVPHAIIRASDAIAIEFSEIVQT